jgi:hypothetical protein
VFAVAPYLKPELVSAVLLFGWGGMPSGTVKWFNTERASALSDRMMAARTYLYISLQCSKPAWIIYAKVTR